jgi:membrane associated rhomboid family serine protease
MIVLFANLSRNDSEAFDLVLSASGIFHLRVSGDQGWSILVEDGRVEDALTAISAFREENRDFPPREKAFGPPTGKNMAGLFGALVLASVYAAVSAGGDPEGLVSTLGASARHILEGELYRTVTGLFLHADAAHLAGNLAGIGIFATAVCAVLGWGLGWLAILATGALGNLLNAWLFETGHVSIGASTAVFSALGILAGHRLAVRIRVPGKRLQALLPLGAGLALLGLLGSSAHTDVTAHLFGFLVGTATGILFGLFLEGRPGKTVQAACALLTGTISVASWIAGYYVTVTPP